MDGDTFERFRHRAVHALQDLNAICEQEFQIGHWERYDYDLDLGTLTFSQDGVARVVAQIQAVGSTSTITNTWLWGWANESLPSSVTARICEVRHFGNLEALTKLTEPKLPDEEYLGWELTAIAAQIVGAKGAYRCPGEHGFLYLLYTDLAFAGSSAALSEAVTAKPQSIECETHGSGQKAFICEHLLSDPRQEWFSDLPTPINPWPDAWCSECNRLYQAQGEWNMRTRIKSRSSFFAIDATSR
jgi:hypothetical protein